MAVTLSIFNNKGGVGKTTYLYHIAHLLYRKGLTVLMVDCDSQCNLTAYSLEENVINKCWAEKGNSIYRVLEQVEKGIGDIRQRKPEPIIDKKLYIVPGDLYLSNFEDRLGDSWIKAKGGSDYFIIPVSPDLFSIRGTENLGDKLVLWEKEWEQCNISKNCEIEIPRGKPCFLGYVMQQHNIRTKGKGMTRGWEIFGDRLQYAITINIVNKLKPLGQTVRVEEGDFSLGKIPNLHSLIPYSLYARKPVFDCGSHEGLNGAHITSAKESVKYFEPMVDKIMGVIQKSK